MTPIERTQQRIRYIQDDIERVNRQFTLGESGSAMKRAELYKLETILSQLKRKLAYQERREKDRA